MNSLAWKLLATLAVAFSIWNVHGEEPRQEDNPYAHEKVDLQDQAVVRALKEQYGPLAINELVDLESSGYFVARSANRPSRFLLIRHPPPIWPFDLNSKEDRIKLAKLAIDMRREKIREKAVQGTLDNLPLDLTESLWKNWNETQDIRARLNRGENVVDSMISLGESEKSLKEQLAVWVQRTGKPQRGMGFGEWSTDLSDLGAAAAIKIERIRQ